ncbi:unnamed protein product [Phaeothamnion confervicola]
MRALRTLCYNFGTTLRGKFRQRSSKYALTAVCEHSNAGVKKKKNDDITEPCIAAAGSDCDAVSEGSASAGGASSAGEDGVEVMGSQPDGGRRRRDGALAKKSQGCPFLINVVVDKDTKQVTVTKAILAHSNGCIKRTEAKRKSEAAMRRMAESASASGPYDGGSGSTLVFASDIEGEIISKVKAWAAQPLLPPPTIYHLVVDAMRGNGGPKRSLAPDAFDKVKTLLTAFGRRKRTSARTGLKSSAT